MYSPEEISTLYAFLKQTGEGNLRKMFVQGKITEIHFNLLMKVVRQTNENDFVSHFQAATFPKLKLNAGELAVREHVWGLATSAFVNMGLLPKDTEQKKVA